MKTLTCPHCGLEQAEELWSLHPDGDHVVPCCRDCEEHLSPWQSLSSDEVPLAAQALEIIRDLVYWFLIIYFALH